MAARECVEDKSSGGESDDISPKDGYGSILSMVHKSGIFDDPFRYGEKASVCVNATNGSAIAKCFVERLVNNVNEPSSLSAVVLKNSSLNLRSRHSDGFHHKAERRALRFDRAGSTESVAISSSGCDSCQSSNSSNASDTASVSEPCSPEGPDSPGPPTPQPMPPLPAAFEDDQHVEMEDSSEMRERSSSPIVDRCVMSPLLLPLELVPALDKCNSSALCQEDDSKTERDEDNSPCPLLEPEVATSTAEGERCHNVNKGSSDQLSVASVQNSDGDYVRRSCSTECSRPAGCGYSSSSPSVSASTPSDSQQTPEVPQIVVCKWLNCVEEMECPSKLVDHIRQTHVDTQTDSETYVCLWENCKVFNRPSCSQSWLERHVLCHGGNKPFKCIVDGCDQRFATQNALERHVNSHFNSIPAPSSQKLGRSKEDTPSKLIKRRKLRYRRRGWRARTEDFFDAGIMEHVRHNLLDMNARTKLDMGGYPGTITFHSLVVARCIETTGKAKVLLHWVPEDILPDVWIPESHITAESHRVIPVSTLPREALAKIDPTLEPSPRHKRKRK